jgi:hypothetical protein
MAVFVFGLIGDLSDIYNSVKPWSQIRCFPFNFAGEEKMALTLFVFALFTESVSGTGF